MSAQLLAFNLARLGRNPDYASDEIAEGLATAPRYERFADAAKSIILAIHAIPRLREDTSLGQVEVYVGRAGATPRHILNRWKTHREEKKHQHGLVAIECPTHVVELWERAAIRVVNKLRNDGRLCVKNASSSSQGQLPGEEYSCIYVTWKKSTEIELEPSSRAYVEEVASEVAGQLRPELTRDQVLRAIDPISRPMREFANVAWHEKHTGG